MSKAFETIPQEFISKALIFDYKTPLPRLLVKINSYGSIVVTKEKQYYGVVDNRTIASKGAIKLSEKFAVGKVAKKVATLDESLSIEKAIHRFYDSATKALPYMEGNKIVGVVKREVMLKAILSMHLLSNYNAGYAMSSPVLAIEKGSGILQAKSTMEDRKIAKIVVIDKGKLFGILSYNDIIDHFANTAKKGDSEKGEKKSSKMSQSTAGEIATKNVYSIDVSRPLEEAIRSMVELEISSILVTKSEKPAGMLTVSDIFEVVVSNATGLEERILISGLDSKTKEYEDELKQELEALAQKVDRFGKMKTDYISLNIKSPRSKNYEMKARLSLAKGGTISADAFGFTLDQAMKKLTDSLYLKVRQKKEIILSSKKEGEREE